METSKLNILVAVPTMGSVHPILTSRLLQWAQEYERGTIHFYFTFKVAPVDRARNQVAKFFLEKTTSTGEHFTHLFFIDSDTIPPTDALKRLLAHDKEFISGLTPILTYNNGEQDWETYDNCFVSKELNPDGSVAKTLIPERNTGLHKIFRCGASCLLIKREAFLKLTPPYFQFITNDENTSHVRSEDINFCDNLTDAGVTLYVDSDVVCQHYKDIML